MNDEHKAQLERLKKMGIELDISSETPESELSALLAQIDNQLAELGQLSDIELDSDEPATIANMSALAIDINVDTEEVIAELGEASTSDDVDFAEDGLAIIFAALKARDVAFSVDDSENDPIVLGAVLNECLQKHGCELISTEELQSIEQTLGESGDNIYEDVDDVWHELCHALNKRGMSLVQLLSKADIDSNGEFADEDEQIHLFALPEQNAQKWTNRGFGNNTLLAFSELFLSE